jgi:hypothetical protein
MKSKSEHGDVVKCGRGSWVVGKLATVGGRLGFESVKRGKKTYMAANMM